MATRNYTTYAVAAVTGSIAPLTDTIKVVFLKDTYTPNIDTDQFYSDVKTQESSGTGYTAGGPTLASKTITKDSTNHRAVFDAADIALSTTTISNYRYLALYKSTGTDNTSQLITLIDLGVTKSTNGDTLNVQFDALGIYYLAI